MDSPRRRLAAPPTPTPQAEAPTELGGRFAIARPAGFLFTFPVAVLRVVDGDTVDTAIDRGFGETSRLRIRLADVDAPERFGAKATPAGAEAARFVEEWLEARAGRLILRTDKGHPSTVGIGDGTFGRWLGNFYRFEAGENLADALVAAGHAARGFRPS